jgi:hypothetical protein
MNEALVFKARESVARQSMLEILRTAPKGLEISTLYNQMMEQGFSEAFVRSAFLYLASVNDVDLNREHKVVAVNHT